MSSTMPPLMGCKSVESVDWPFGRAEREDGVMRSRNASAPGPEKWCWTLHCELGDYSYITKPTCVRRRTDSPSRVSNCASRQCSGRCTAPAWHSRQTAQIWRHICCAAHTSWSCPIALPASLSRHIGPVAAVVARVCGVYAPDSRGSASNTALHELSLPSKRGVKDARMLGAAPPKLVAPPFCVCEERGRNCWADRNPRVQTVSDFIRQ